MAIQNESTISIKESSNEVQKTSGSSAQKIVVVIILGLIILLGAFLRFYQLGAYGVGNTYYAATVQSMLTSWRNFFFVAFEPGGSVSVDKPPLGFWIQATSAYFLGVNGFALALPQAIAGILSIPLLYSMVKRQFGAGAGLLAALALAVMPVAVSTERNNTIDGMLLFVLLLATWAFLKSVQKGKFRYLLLGAFLVGVGFNIKMLQAYLPLPALYAVYLLGAPHSWIKRILHLVAASMVLLVVSLSWAIAVDLTPPEDRPFVGSSQDNTVMELIVGHNGLSRIFAGVKGRQPDDGARAGADDPTGFGVSGNADDKIPPPPPTNDGQPGQLRGNPPMPPSDGGTGLFPQNRPPLPGGNVGLAGNQPAGGNTRNREVGEAGALRLFTEPLVTEAGWLLPLALLGVPLILVVTRWQWPLSEKHLALFLWAGWLLPESVYFSLTTGIFHAYYLIMLGPPLAALVGATTWALWQILEKRPWVGWVLVPLISGVTLAFQIITLWDYAPYAIWVIAIAIMILTAGAGILGIAALFSKPRIGKVALGITLAATLVAPLVWSGLTTFNIPNAMLPSSGPATQDGPNTRNSSEGGNPLMAYLSDNTNPDSYLVATVRANDAAPFILETLRSVLVLGGFMGSDNVIEVEELTQMVADGELRFILGQGLAQNKPEINEWVNRNCTTVDLPFLSGTERPPANPAGAFPDRPGQQNVLYDCGSS